MQTIAIGVKCGICDQIDARELHRAIELDRIRQWQRNGPVKHASIDSSYNTIETLDGEINVLISKRRTRSLSLNGVVNKTLETDDLGHKVQDPSMTLRETDQPEKAAASVGTEAQANGHLKRGCISTSLADDAAHAQSAVAEIQMLTDTILDEKSGQDRAVDHNEYTSGLSSDTDLEAVRSSGDDEHDCTIVSTTTYLKQDKQHALSEHACQQIQKHIIDPLLKDTTFKDFHPIVKEIADRVECRLSFCVRDLEELLIRRSPNSAATIVSYLKFCKALLRWVRNTVVYLDDNDQRRPRDRVYPQVYFLRLLDQIRHHAAMLANTRQAPDSSRIVWTDDEALKPGLEKEDELEVINNRSPFSPVHWNKFSDPISSSAYHAIGGLNGLEKSLASDTVGDLSMDKEYFDGAIWFDNAEIASEDVALTKGVKRRAASPPYVTSQDRRKLFHEGFMFRHKPEYDSDGDSVVSVSDSIFSTATDSSQSSAEFLEAVDEFFGVLIRDTRIRSLFPEAIRIMDAEKVERNFVRLLQLYAKDLRLEAKSTFEKGASRLVRRYSASLALRTTRCFDRGRSCFAEGQELEEITAPLVMDMINLPEADDSEDSGAEEVDQFAKVRSFMVGGTPFLKLQDNFQNFVDTVSALSLPLPTREVRHLMTTTSIQGVSGVHQLKEVFLLREPNSILGLNSNDEAVFFCTFSSVPIQLSTPLVYYFNLFRDYAAGGDPATEVAEWLHLDVSSPVFHTAAHQ